MQAAAAAATARRHTARPLQQPQQQTSHCSHCHSRSTTNSAERQQKKEELRLQCGRVSAEQCRNTSAESEKEAEQCRNSSAERQREAKWCRNISAERQKEAELRLQCGNPFAERQKEAEHCRNTSADRQKEAELRLQESSNRESYAENQVDFCKKPERLQKKANFCQEANCCLPEQKKAKHCLREEEGFCQEARRHCLQKRAKLCQKTNCCLRHHNNTAQQQKKVGLVWAAAAFISATTLLLQQRCNSSGSAVFVLLLLLLMPGAAVAPPTAATVFTAAFGHSVAASAAAALAPAASCDPDMALLPAVDNSYCQRRLAHSNNNNSSQCLLRFDESHKETFCRHVVTNNYNKNNYYNTSDRIGGSFSNPSFLYHPDVRLPHCCGHRLHDSLDPAARQDVQLCLRQVDALLALDAQAARLSCHFAALLTRYDCRQPYSVNTGCDDCLEAYKQWVCATTLPHWVGEWGEGAPKGAKGGAKGRGPHRLKPCKTLCHRVEQTCPFFLPGDRAPHWPTQYAGEPTFLCLDPNIPETGAQVTHSVHGPPSCCHMPCQGATCPDPPSAAACQGIAHHPPAPALDACDAPSSQSPLAPPPSGNPCVPHSTAPITTSRSSRTTSRSQPLAIIVVLLHLRHAAATRTMLFTTRK